jgi:hypothetical protein
MLGNDNPADDIRYKLKQADEYRARAKRWRRFAEWIKPGYYNSEVKPIVVAFPQHKSMLGTKVIEQRIELEADETHALIEFLIKKAEHSEKIADYIDKEIAK